MKELSPEELQLLVTTKSCANQDCSEINPQSISNFNKRAKSPDGLQIYCKTCNSDKLKAHYKNQPERYKEKNKRRKRSRQEFIIAYLLGHPCIDCGESDIVVLEFDHVRGSKRKELATLVLDGVSLETLKEEIAKCDVVCANCHRRRTAKRLGSYKLGVDD